MALSCPDYSPTPLILLTRFSLVPHLPSVWTAVSSSGVWAVGRSHWFVQWGGMAEVVQSSWIPRKLQQLFPESWNPIKSCFWTLQGGSAVNNTRYSLACYEHSHSDDTIEQFILNTCVSYRFWRRCCCPATCSFCPRQDGWAKRNAAAWPP